MSGKVPRVLITGASGLLGRAVIKIIQENEWEAVGIAYSRFVDQVLLLHTSRAIW